MEPQALETLEKRWKAACRLLFKEEVGGISEYAPWLLERNEPIIHRKSSISGKEITYANTEYDENSKWADFNEMDFEKKFEPPSINEIKDIDSLIEALTDRFYYAGNIILGNSNHIARSSSISDSFYVLESGRFGDSKYIAHCIYGRFSEDCFGCNGVGNSQVSMKCAETHKHKRTFEVWSSQHCSDCYYSYGLNTCSECMFCFHLRGKRYAIGNLELEPGKYNEIKKKLLSEMAEELKKNKRLPSLVDIVTRSKMVKPVLLQLEQKFEPPKDKRVIEDAFSKTCQLLFGRPLKGGIDRYSEWLMRHVPKIESHPSALSGKPVYRGDYCNYSDLPKDRLILLDEGPLVEELKLSREEVDRLSFSTVHAVIGKISFFSPEYRDGTNTNIIECPTTGFASNCYRGLALVYAKYAAYSFWPRDSEHVFGCKQMFDSGFCINCYYSIKLKRCFEMDDCRDCTDAYFCHNCENVHDSMFCFNVKNKKYAIGNAELGREKYLEIREKVLKELLGELEKNGDFRYDIYDIGARK